MYSLKLFCYLFSSSFLLFHKFMTKSWILAKSILIGQLSQFLSNDWRSAHEKLSSLSSKQKQCCFSTTLEILEQIDEKGMKSWLLSLYWYTWAILHSNSLLKPSIICANFPSKTTLSIHSWLSLAHFTAAGYYISLIDAIEIEMKLAFRI